VYEPQYALSKQQYEGLLNLLQQANTGSSHSTNHIQTSQVNVTNSGTSVVQWVLDTGATDHICPTKSLFTKLYKINPISITLPNSDYVLAACSGRIVVGQLILDDVLFVPNFKVHLISVSKLTLTMSCLAIFTHLECSEWKMTSSANKWNALYMLSNSIDSHADKFCSMIASLCKIFDIDVCDSGRMQSSTSVSNTIDTPSLNKDHSSSVSNDVNNDNSASVDILSSSVRNMNDNNFVWHMCLGHVSNKVM
jgi:hypothetical protein